MSRLALTLTALLAVLEVAGARPLVAVLSGTPPDGPFGLFLGLLYALTFFSVVVLGVPALAAGLALDVGPRALRRARGGTPPRAPS